MACGSELAALLGGNIASPYCRIVFIRINLTTDLVAMEEEPAQEDSNVFEFTSLTLFDEDPLSPDLSLQEEEEQVAVHALRLFGREELLSETRFKVHLELVHSRLKGYFEMAVTSYRLVFFRLRRSQQIDTHADTESQCQAAISLPFGFVEEVDVAKRQIVVGLKTGMVYRVKPFTQVNNIHQAMLHGLAYLPFFTKEVGHEEVSVNYDCLAELQRMRIPSQNYAVIPNINGQLSPTYPKYYVIAKAITEGLMLECIKLRNQGRIPVLTYYCSRCGAGLWRAARTMPSQQANKHNKAYLREISRSLITVELRASEPVRDKEVRTDLSYRRFESLSGLQDLFRKMLVLYARSEPLLKVLGRWFQDVGQLLLTAYFVIRSMQLGKEVLLQEHLAFDRAAQVSALVQLIIDPFFRTVHGFSLLIEKEFVSFGHPFAKRLGFQGQRNGQSSPVFIEFLECVNQLIVTHPQCFEFSSFYLARIGYEAYSTKYNNFYYNTQREKLSDKWAGKTPSIWQMPMRKEYYNYQWVEKVAIKPLHEVRKPPSVKQFIIWKEYFDLVVEMKCEYPDQPNVKQRRSSLYKILHRRDSKES